MTGVMRWMVTSSTGQTGQVTGDSIYTKKQPECVKVC